MKTIKREKENKIEYRRVTDLEADKLTQTGWSFCPKTEWKKNVRDFGKEETLKEDKYKNKNPKNAKASKV
jgi:hypothetical protein